MKALPWFLRVVSIMLACLPALRAQDVPRPEEIKRYEELTKSVELNGTIRSAATAKPGWYHLVMEGENGKPFVVLLTPDTKFYEHYQAMEADKAYARTVVGQKVRLIHRPAFDEALRGLWASDVMFVKDWNEHPPPAPTKPTVDMNALRALQNLVPNRGVQLTK